MERYDIALIVIVDKKVIYDIITDDWNLAVEITLLVKEARTRGMEIYFEIEYLEPDN